MATAKKAKKRTMKGIQAELKSELPLVAYSSDRSRGFELTSIKAAYVFERFNEAFGLLGDGWKYTFTKFKERTIGEEGSEKVSEIGVKVTLRYKKPDGEWSEKISHIGGKKVIKGNLTDARKSAITDALTKIGGMLGVGELAFKGLVSMDTVNKAIAAGKTTLEGFDPDSDGTKATAWLKES